MPSLRVAVHACSLVLLTTCWVAADPLPIKNEYPIVLVHGFTGWGPDEMFGYPYWGELQGDLPTKLRARGYKVLQATIGPYASNWDRACELYCYIKGCRVDYGQKHAQTHDHSRYGRTYPGIYPEWGTLDEHGKRRKIHLIGHSMGGQTIRMLAQMLATGSHKAPIEEDPKDPSSSELFQGGRGDWVQSITAIASPNQGTFVVDMLDRMSSVLEKLATGLFGLIGLQGDSSKMIFDAKLDQWGLGPKQSSESIKQYMHRIFATKMFQPGFQDISLYSMTSAGAQEENTWVTVLPNVHYFSISTRDSYAAKNWRRQNIQLPNIKTMLFMLSPMSIFLGSRFGPDHGYPESWQINDGVVSTESQMSDGIAPMVQFNGVPVFGKWMVKLFDRMDHEAIIGLTLHTKVLPIWIEHLDVLRALTCDDEAVQLQSESTKTTTEGAGNPMVLDYFSAPPAPEQTMETLCARTKGWSQYIDTYCTNMLGVANTSVEAQA